MGRKACFGGDSASVTGWLGPVGLAHPPPHSPQEKERQRLENLRRKEEAEQLRRQKVEEDKRRRLEEVKL